MEWLEKVKEIMTEKELLARALWATSEWEAAAKDNARDEEAETLLKEANGLFDIITEMERAAQ